MTYANNEDRNADIKKAFDAGNTTTEIGYHFELSESRIRQIVGLIKNHSMTTAAGFNAIAEIALTANWGKYKAMVRGEA